MCGISGYFGKKKISQTTVRSTLKLMKNRGPDNQNYYFNKYIQNIYLLHSRLSIIDINQRSDQPFETDDHTLIFNGEIYNYLELKKKISHKVNFKTQSDTEVIIHYYKLFGLRCFNFFQGMWSIAIFDKKNNKLILSRDRFGEKPLYYKIEKNGIYFGSEIKYIKNLNLNKKLKINYDKIRDYLQFGYKSIFKKNSSFFKDINIINSGSCIVIDKKLNLKFFKYWKPKNNINKKLSLQKTIKRSKELLSRSVELTLRSDVKIALCLSGGIDSNAIAGISKKKFKKKLETFSIIDNKDTRYNEKHQIDLTTKSLGLKKNYINISDKLDLSRLKKQIKYHDSPVFTITNYLQNFLAEKIAKKNYKVVLSGSGADEVFSGYYDHQLMYLFEVRGKKNFYNSHLNNWNKHILPIIRNKYFKNPKMFFNDKNQRNYIYDHNKELKKFFLKPKKLKFKEKLFSKSLLKNRMFNEVFFENVPVATHSEDSNFMQYSIENRNPFLNKDLFEFMQTVPVEFYMQKGFTKYILRSALKEYVPDNIRLQRKKVGFNASINSLINLRSKKFFDFVNKKSPIYKIVKKNALLKSLKTKNNENFFSKFIFSFISAKIFLEINN